MISSAKQADKNKKRYDEENFIDAVFIRNLMNVSTKCYYCDIDMQFILTDRTLCTLERFNNNIGHVRDNVTLACLKCNLSRVGQRNLNQ